MRLILFSVWLLLFLAFPVDPQAQQVFCVKCHGKLAQGKHVHSAINSPVGCDVCHSGIIAKSTPHKKSNMNEKGLMALQPDLCYSCHEKELFTKKDVHTAISMGCTICHNPHSAKNDKLLFTGQPDLCYPCHKKGMFTKKDVHAAINMGCTSCHNPHSTDTNKLLVAGQPGLCYTCHDKAMFTKKHVHAAIGKGHTIGMECTLCHNPHSTDTNKLLVAGQPGLCYTCHEKAMFTKKKVQAAIGKGNTI